MADEKRATAADPQVSDRVEKPVNTSRAQHTLGAWDKKTDRQPPDPLIAATGKRLLALRDRQRGCQRPHRRDSEGPNPDPQPQRTTRNHLVLDHLILLTLAFAAVTLIPWATSFAEDTTSATVGGDATPSGGQDFFSRWFAMATRTQNEQPHWMTPLVTVTPRLEQEFRYDQYLGDLPHNGGRLKNFGAGKGLEIIPSEQTEIIFGVPPYLERSDVPKKKNVEGFGDWPVFLVKYRFLSANEENGNDIVTAFFQMSAPTGTNAFSNNAYLFQPTIAAGKGWGDFDVQATFSEQYSVKTNQKGAGYGNPLLANVATQYHFSEYFWPEIEGNYTYWPNGTKEGRSQFFLTTGIIFGRFQIHERVKAIIGLGYQIALAPTNNPVQKDNYIISTRMTF